MDSFEVPQLVLQSCNLAILLQAFATWRRTVAKTNRRRRGMRELEHEGAGEVCRAFAAGLLFPAPSSISLPVVRPVTYPSGRRSRHYQGMFSIAVGKLGYWVFSIFGRPDVGIATHEVRAAEPPDLTPFDAPQLLTNLGFPRPLLISSNYRKPFPFRPCMRARFWCFMSWNCRS